MLFYKEAVCSACFQAASTLLRAGHLLYSGLFSLFPGTQIMPPRPGMENHVSADTLTGKLF